MSTSYYHLENKITKPLWLLGGLCLYACTPQPPEGGTDTSELSTGSSSITSGGRTDTSELSTGSSSTTSEGTSGTETSDNNTSASDMTDGSTGDNETTCGDGVVQTPEQCDEGENNGVGQCTTECTWKNLCGTAQKLVHSEGKTNDAFGDAIAVGKDTIVIGAWYNDDNDLTEEGAAFVCEYINNQWVQTAKLIASNFDAEDEFGLDHFGISVAMSASNTIVVGARLGEGLTKDGGAAYVFEKIDNTWVETHKLQESDNMIDEQWDDGHHWFGISVAIEEDTIVVGASTAASVFDINNKAFVYEKTGDQWVEKQMLKGPSGQLVDHFGHDVAIDGGTIVVGAYNEEIDNQLTGAAYVFEKDGELWGAPKKLVASDGTHVARFGESVAISGNTIVIGASLQDDHGGTVYIFEKGDNGWPQTETQKLKNSDQDISDVFGEEVAIKGDMLVVTASGDDDKGENSGSAYVFEKVGNQWVETKKLVGYDTDQYDFFGYGLALNNDMIAVGAQGIMSDKGLDDAPAVYLFPL